MSGSSSGSAASTPSGSSSSQGVPRVGGVRCYWALLSPQFPNPSVPGSKLELLFVHPDPILAIHLQRQRLSMMGRGVLEFIHPAEREQARRDLTSAISTDDLQGSVTRVRFARLSWIRKILGGKPEELEIPDDASKFAEDDEYLILDIVLNWVAEGVVLAFFHAIKDKDPVQNNDPQRRHEEWNNWCGTAQMGEDQIEALHQNFSTYIPLPPPSRFPPSRVFQLHTSATSPVRPNSLVFSWPPARPPRSASRNDGLYDAEEYSNLMKGVDMDPAQLSRQQDEIRTTCTTRFGAQHSITTEGVYRVVSSVFIPYGSLIFACFQTIKQVELQPRNPAVGTSTQKTMTNGHAQLAQQQQVGGSTITGAGGAYTVNQTPDWSTPTPSDWSRAPPQAQPVYGLKPEDSYQSTGHDRIPYPQPYEPHPHPHSQIIPQSQPQTHSTSHGSHDSSRGYYDDGLSYSSLPPGDAYPTPPSAAYNDRSPPQMGGSASRPLVRPPGNVDCCRICGLKESPEWRRSETGIKDLCNACGLRLARQVAKREGRQKPRKKKDRMKGE